MQAQTFRNAIRIISRSLFLAYLQGVDAAPSQPANQAAEEDDAAAIQIHPSLLDDLWRESDAAGWGLRCDEFEHIVLNVGFAQNFGLDKGTTASPRQQASFYRSVTLADLVLARACANGIECAWLRFLNLYKEPLLRAAIAIAQNETVGRDLADSLYAELYGLTARDGVRRCPLDSYRGRGSLLGWLRTTLAQRHVDHHRRTYREQPLEELDAPAADQTEAAAASPMLANAVEHALAQQNVEERFLLAAYFLDERTLAQIAAVLHVHEATVSRRLRRATDAVHKQVLQNLRKAGMSQRAAAEALGTDPRDVALKPEINIDLKKLLQSAQFQPFPESGLQTEKVPRDTLGSGQNQATP